MCIVNASWFNVHLTKYLCFQTLEVVMHEHYTCRYCRYYLVLICLCGDGNLLVVIQAHLTLLSMNVLIICTKFSPCAQKSNWLPKPAQHQFSPRTGTVVWCVKVMVVLSQSQQHRLINHWLQIFLPFMNWTNCHWTLIYQDSMLVTTWRKHLSPRKPSGVKLAMFCVIQERWMVADPEIATLLNECDDKHSIHEQEGHRTSPWTNT